MKKIIWTAILTMTVLLTGCAGAPTQEPERTEFFAMDTAMEFTVYGEANLLDEAKSIICSVEEQVSVTDEHSVLYTIDHTGTGKLTGNSAELMEKAGAVPPHQRRTGSLRLPDCPGLGLYHR